MTRKETLEFARGLWHKIHHPHPKRLCKLRGHVYEVSPHGAVLAFLNDQNQEVHHFIARTDLKIGEMVTVTYERV